jgi:hypothetical protein
MRAHVRQALIERDGRALERLERERERDDGGVEQAARVADGQRAGGGHEMRAVDEREALLRLEHDGLQARAPQRRAAVEAVAGQLRLALADEHERDVGERREVARGADRAF